MMKTPFFLLCIFIASVECKRELQFVQAIWNHGESAPSGLPYPKDKNDESKWPRGWGQLTNKGIGKLLEHGQLFEKRYSGSLTSKKFKPQEVHIRSNADDLSLTSAQVLLNGFYQPSGEYLWRNGAWQALSWQPFPVHNSAPLDNDPLLNPTDFDCPLYSGLLRPIIENFENRQKEKFAILFDILGQETGFGHKISFDNVTRLNDINKEVAYNLTQPPWVKNKFSHYDYKTALQLVTNLYRGLKNTRFFSFFSIILYYNRKLRWFANKRLSFLRGGYLLGDWLKRAQAVVNGEQANPSKMVLYSTNENTITALAFALNINDTVEQPIPPAAAIILEIWKNDDDAHEIQLHYLVNGELLELEIPDCGEVCTFEKFFELYKKNTIFEERDLYRECTLTFCDTHRTPIWPTGPKKVEKAHTLATTNPTTPTKPTTPASS